MWYGTDVTCRQSPRSTVASLKLVLDVVMVVFSM
jgi:hypothetical protein